MEIINEWKELKYSNLTNSMDSIEYLKFDICHDNEFVYIALKVFDDTVFTDTAKSSNRRDGITILFDARPDPERSLGRGLREWDAFLPVTISPGKTIKEMKFIKDSNPDEKLPDEITAASIITQYGYCTEIAIPVKYIIEKQGADWNEFRINICRNNINNKNDKIIKKWWQPEWGSKENYNSSGTFRKNEK